MAIFNSIFFNKIRGRIDNLIFYEVMGQQRMRKQTDKPLPAPSCTQYLQRCRMRSAVALYRANRHTDIPYIWKQETKTKVMSGYNLFISYNIPVFNQNHRICDYSMLHFSCGRLELPLHLEISEYGDGHIHLNWKNAFPRCSPRIHDCLHAVWLKNNGSFCLQIIPVSSVIRAEEKAVLNLPEAGKENLHLYLYFSDREGNCFSPNKYFYLESKK